MTTAPKALPRVLERPFEAGPESRALFDEEQERLTPGLQSIALFSRLAIASGRGCSLRDEDGREYLDLVAGIGVASIGHGHPEYARALSEQVSKVSVGSFTTRRRLEFARRFAGIAPKGLDRLQLYSSGAEAVEAAFRLAKSYTKKYEFIGFWNGFHGKTGGVLGLLGDDAFKEGLGPFAPGMYLSPYPNTYRCPFGTAVEHDCAAHCLEFLRAKIRKETSHAVAAVIAEPIQGTAGNVIPPKGWLAGLREITREIGALWISDEMICGFGRTGRWFGCQHEDAVPDILTLGKGLGGGFPVSAVATTAEIAGAKPFANPSGSSSSYGGNPLASAACEATLRIIDEDGLVDNAKVIGEFLLSRLSPLKDKYPFVGDVRGRGLMIGVELVKDKTSKEPLAKDICRFLFEECLARGLMTMAYTPSVRFNPPLLLTRDEAQRGASLFDEALAAVARRFSL